MGGYRVLARDISQRLLLFLVLGAVSFGCVYSQVYAYEAGGNASTVLSIKRLSVIFVAGAGMWYLGEAVRPGKIIGVLLMVSGGVLLFHS